MVADGVSRVFEPVIPTLRQKRDFGPRNQKRNAIRVIVLLLFSTIASSWLAVSQLGWNASLFFSKGTARPVGDVVWKSCGFEGLPGADCGSIMYVVGYYIDARTHKLSSVPLDYLDKDAGTARIALARYPASKGPRKGIVLINPGGPGGSRLLCLTPQN